MRLPQLSRAAHTINRLITGSSSLSERILEGPGGTKAPAAAILPVQQCETLVAGMGDNDSKTLAGARRSGCFGFRIFFAAAQLAAASGRLGGAAAMRCHLWYVIVDRCSVLDLAPAIRAAHGAICTCRPAARHPTCPEGAAEK